MTQQIFRLLMAALAVFAGDVEAQLHAKPVAASGVSYEMDGYSVLPPPGQDWFELKRGKQYVYFGKKLKSRTHSFIAIALATPIAGKFEHPEEFRAHVHKMLPQSGDERTIVIESRAELDAAAGRFCVKHYTKAEDRDAIYARGRALLTETIGVSCLHPDIRGLTIDVSYTERGYPAEASVELRDEGERFVRSLKFTSR